MLLFVTIVRVAVAFVVVVCLVDRLLALRFAVYVLASEISVYRVLVVVVVVAPHRLVAVSAKGKSRRGQKSSSSKDELLFGVEGMKSDLLVRLPGSLCAVRRLAPDRAEEPSSIIPVGTLLGETMGTRKWLERSRDLPDRLELSTAK